MPLAVEPGTRYPMVLDSDKGKKDPPTFYTRHLSGREWMALTDLAEKIEKPENLAAHLKDLFTALQQFLTGWDRVTDREGNALPFEERYFADALDPMEGSELFFKILEAQKLGYADAKKSALQSASDTEATAKDTTPERVETAQPPQAP